MNKRRKNKRGYIIIAILVVFVVALSIAYAAMSTTLKINYGNVVLSQQSWNVGFQPNASLAATAYGTSDTGRSCGTATVTATTVTVGATSLSKPGDYCIWSLTIKNQGSIAAKLKTITPTQPTGTGVTCSLASNGQIECGNIQYKLATSSDGVTRLSPGAVINASNDLPVYLMAKYIGNDLATAETVQTGASFSLLFEQQ